MFLSFFLFFNLSAQETLYSIDVAFDINLLKKEYAKTTKELCGVEVYVNSVYSFKDDIKTPLFAFDVGYRGGSNICYGQSSSIFLDAFYGYRFNFNPFIYLDLYIGERLDFIYTFKDIVNIYLIPDKFGIDLLLDATCCIHKDYKIGESFGIMLVAGMTGICFEFHVGIISNFK